jgi:hypothetical protein
MSFESNNASEAVVTLIDGMQPEERTALAHNLRMFFPVEFGGHITVSPATQPEIENEPDNEIIENPSTGDQELFGSLNVEEQIKVVALKEAMAKKFERLGAKPEDFLVLRSKSWSESEREWIYDGCLTIAYAAPKGIDLACTPHSPTGADLRSWNSIFANNDENDKRFIVEVDGEEFDTREGMTAAAYVSLYDLCTHSSPGGCKEEAATFDTATFTYLTGSPIKDNWVTKDRWDFWETGDGRQAATLYPHTANRETIFLSPTEEWDVPDFIDSQGVLMGSAPHGNPRIHTHWGYFNGGEVSDPSSFRPAVLLEISEEA